MADVVGVKETLVSAAGELATVGAEVQGATQSGRDGPCAAAQVDRADDGAVAGEAPERFRGDVRAIVERRRQSAVGRERVLVDVNDELMAVAAVAAERAGVAWGTVVTYRFW